MLKENEALTRIYSSRKKQLHKELHNVYSSPHIIGVIKSNIRLGKIHKMKETDEKSV